MTEFSQRRASEAGYSLIEVILVLGVMGVLSGMAVFQIGATRPAALGDGAMRVVMAQMNAAREMAITQRRNMRLAFVTPNQVQIIREEAPGTTLTTISTTLFEGGLQFLTVSPLPDTPDAFGNGTAVTFPTATGSPLEIKFATDGTFVNQDGLSLNGSVFVALPNQALSARAVTIFGSTGRIRGYRWNGTNWKPV
jgi:prepilin-type N-terminal cleavage/methylation domain-containing protein